MKPVALKQTKSAVYNSMKNVWLSAFNLFCASPVDTLEDFSKWSRVVSKMIFESVHNPERSNFILRADAVTNGEIVKKVTFDIIKHLASPSIHEDRVKLKEDTMKRFLEEIEVKRKAT